MKRYKIPFSSILKIDYDCVKAQILTIPRSLAEKIEIEHRELVEHNTDEELFSFYNFGDMYEIVFNE